MQRLLDLMNLIENVRQAAKLVTEQARHVRINIARIPAYARSLPFDPADSPTLDPRYHYRGLPAETVAFVLTLDTINFGSGYFPHLRKRTGLSGYFTVAACLTERFRARGPFTAVELAEFDAQGCAGLFQQDMGQAPCAELMGLFAAAWNDLGRYLLDRFGGSFEALVETAGRSAERLVQLLAVMPYFRDVERYRRQEVPFYKRAQLTAADLSLLLSGEGLGFFRDLDRLTIFADNLVPHVLRLDGVLVYDDHLASRVGKSELIPAGSEEEIEIRASAVHAVELLVQQLNGAGHATSASRLDYLLWNRGQQPYYKARPRHRTRTVYY